MLTVQVIPKIEKAKMPIDMKIGLNYFLFIVYNTWIFAQVFSYLKLSPNTYLSNNVHCKSLAKDELNVIVIPLLSPSEDESLSESGELR